MKTNTGIKQKGHRRENHWSKLIFSTLSHTELAQRHSKTHVASECRKEHLLNIRQSIK
jgi:hypothetical protein